MNEEQKQIHDLTSYHNVLTAILLGEITREDGLELLKAQREGR